MEIEKIRQLTELAAASPFAEFIYQEEGGSLTLRREAGRAAAEAPDPMIATAARESVPAGHVPVQADASVQPQSSQTPIPSASLAADTLAAEDVITSPLVGVFYTAPSEGADPFVTLGSRVRKGQVLGIIETMKLMNELEAEEDAEITGVLVENEQVVEYGQPLFRIRKL
ncbi:MAG: acetyl-CoA carboxylase biotin carboxyl carrier protein [Lachnospiraceae bacterium]|nr:acetyl-CoA carboxylase biotin carboxyl carrier protein [Lachnospiraceae bacterium]